MFLDKNTSILLKIVCLIIDVLLTGNRSTPFGVIGNIVVIIIV